MRPIVRSAADGAMRVVPAERFPWFVLASLILLMSALWVGRSAVDGPLPSRSGEGARA